MHDQSIYEYLSAHKLLKKVTAIVLCQGQAPSHLKEEAEQDTHIAWSQLTVNPEYQHSQICRYAVMAGKHAVLRVRRNLGAVVAIPSHLFGSGQQGLFLECIGAAVNPENIDDYTDSAELATDWELPIPDKVSKEVLSRRLSGISLTKGQRAVAICVLCDGLSIEETSVALNLGQGYVKRLVTQLTEALYDAE